MSPTPSPSPAVAPARVLVIDDEPQIRRFLDIGLRAQGYAVRLAETAGEGLQALALEGADLVVLDMGLPDRDGMDALRELRARPRTRQGLRAGCRRPRLRDQAVRRAGIHGPRARLPARAQ
jgi:CheY-like chemotaxis protein